MLDLATLIAEAVARGKNPAPAVPAAPPAPPAPRPAAPAPPAAAPAPASSAAETQVRRVSPLAALLASADGLQAAVALTEILGPPIALRGEPPR